MSSDIHLSLEEHSFDAVPRYDFNSTTRIIILVDYVPWLIPTTPQGLNRLLSRYHSLSWQWWREEFGADEYRWLLIPPSYTAKQIFASHAQWDNTVCLMAQLGGIGSSWVHPPRTVPSTFRVITIDNKDEWVLECRATCHCPLACLSHPPVSAAQVTCLGGHSLGPR